MASTNASEPTSTRAALEELRALLGKNIQGNVRLFNRIATLAQQASKELSADPGSRNLPKGNELLSRWLELNLSYWSLLLLSRTNTRVLSRPRSGPAIWFH